jgi:hypothetical protein
MSASPSTQAFDSIRPVIVERLLEFRSRLDTALARSEEAAARSQMEGVLGDIRDYLATGDLATHQAFLSAFLAKRATEEAGASAALSTLVAIGDTAVQTVQEHIQGSLGDELALLIAQASFGSVRILNDLLAEQLRHRRSVTVELSAAAWPLPGRSPGP